MIAIPYPKNAKRHPANQVELIARSIQRFGWQQPIKVGQGNVIIVGHGRFLAWTEYGKKYELPEPWVINEVGETVSGAPADRKLTEQEEKAYRLADNQINALSDSDMVLVDEELKLLDDDLIDLTGYDRDRLVELSENDDNQPAPPQTPKSLVGDLYVLGNHRLLCGDSTMVSDVEKLMDGKLADMVFTDPPYNVDYEGSAGKIKNDKFKSSEAFYQFLLDAFTNMATFTKRGGCAYIAHADSEGLNFRRAFIDSGFLLKQCIIWNKDRFVLGRQDYQWKHEPILLGVVKEEAGAEPVSEYEPVLYGWQDGEKHDFYGGRKQTTVWDIPRPTKSKEHPTMKPVELVSRAVLNSSKQDDIVLDLFAGGGSTMIACEKTGRQAFLMELDPKFADVIVQRYVEYTGNKNIIKNGEKIVWETTKI